MTLTQFKYVVEVAETGSINKAAINLYTSQSVVSTAIKKLESELGKKIFHRTSRGIDLTPFGKTFLSHITPIHLQIKQLDKLVANAADTHVASLSIASSGWSFISTVLARLHNKYQAAGLRLELYEVYGNDSLDLVANGTAEIGFNRRYSCYRSTSNKMYNAMNLQFFPIHQADVGVTLGPQNPLFFNESNTITPDMLKDSTQIIPLHIDGGPYSDIFDRLHIPPSSNRFLVSSRATMYELCSSTNSYYVNSAFINDPKNIRTQGVISPQRTLLLENCDIKSEFGWFKKESYTPSSIAMDAISIMSEYFSSEMNLSV